MARTNGNGPEEDEPLDVVAERGQEVGVLEEALVVLEPDPGGIPDAAPIGERVVHAGESGNGDGEQMQREHGDDEQPRDQSRVRIRRRRRRPDEAVVGRDFLAGGLVAADERCSS